MDAKVWRNGGYIPEQAHKTDVGYDIRTARTVYVFDDSYTFIPLDIVIKPPNGYYFELVPRSSTFKKHGIILVNSVGIIDPSYSSNGDCLGAMVYKLPGHLESHDIPKGTKLFQLILRRVYHADWVDMTGQPYEGNTRGGWGSTGD